MIPQIIHYCWFGNKEKPKLVKKCIKSWKKFLPDYEIKEWNEDNFDVNIIPYVKEAYEAKKYAFVSDYARFWILYHYGGLYFDTDVEIIRPMSHIIERGAFMGCENEVIGAREDNDNCDDIPQVAPGLGLGCNIALGIYKEILDYYQTLHFINEDGSQNLHTVVEFTTNILIKHGLKSTNEIQLCADIYIYPKDYFCPISYTDMKLRKTENTVSIHHYAGSWLSWDAMLRHRFPWLAVHYPKILYYTIILPYYELKKYGFIK